MAYGTVDVVDLTDSTHEHEHHTAMFDDVIVLEDSLEENNSSYVPSAVTVQHETSKTAEKKKEQAYQPTNEAKQIRECSLLRNHIGDCPICLDTIGTNPLVSTLCGHVFCEQCLTQALEIENECPTCRLPLLGKFAYHPLFLNIS